MDRDFHQLVCEFDGTRDNSEWARFKKDGFPLYPDLCILFGDTYATGEQAIGSSHNLTLLDDEDNCEDDGNDVLEGFDDHHLDEEGSTPGNPSTPIHDKHNLDRTPNTKRRRKSGQYNLTTTCKAIEGTMEEESSVLSSGQLAPIGACLNEFHIKIIRAWIYAQMLDKCLHMKEPCRDGKQSGAEWVSEIIHGHSDRIYEAFRLERHVFLNLCDLMIEKGRLKDSRYIKVDEQLGIFLLMVGHKSSMRTLCERFQHSPKTVSKYFTVVLKAMIKLSNEVIKAPSFEVVPEEIMMDPNHSRYFKDQPMIAECSRPYSRIPNRIFLDHHQENTTW
ncbi:uncharacterized protein LOC115732310 [Rhodamnia argentea]|uniref:Uncharacterized protein LOC115732310 n=1 Tax=Rhodamnia argentea TaxID=178133 RepID=A0ABM3H6E9_9MYRT|nr:uncharacterized protein LOC115732310 [Rhodamnia argentea]